MTASDPRAATARSASGDACSVPAASPASMPETDGRLSLSFRVADEGDTDALLTLEECCFPGDSWSREALRSHLASDCGHALLCFAGEVCVGEMLFTVIPPEWEILRVATRPDFRRRGIGRTLMEGLHAAVEAAGCTDGFLEVRASGAAAQALYEQTGYRRTGLRRRYYRSPVEDAVLMHRHTDPKAGTAETTPTAATAGKADVTETAEKHPR